MRILPLFALAIALIAAPASAVQAPYHETFEAETPCATSCTASCLLGPSGWMNATSDDRDWLVDTNGTSSALTGPSVDHDPGLPYGRYLYLETSAPCSANPFVAELLSPPLELSGLTMPTARFWYHQYGADIGALHVDVLDETLSVIALDVIAPMVAGNLDAWQQSAPIDLTPFGASAAVRLRLRGVHSGTGPAGDQAIDDFLFYDNAIIDVAVIALVSPSRAICADPSAVPITVAIENSGGLPASAVTLSYSVDGAAPVVESLGVVGPYTTLLHTFATAADFGSFGAHSLELAVTAPGDANASNDSSSATTLVANSYDGEFLETFEGPETHWRSGGVNASWARGTPNKSVISGASSGSNAWVTHLTSGYPNDERSFVEMVCPIDLTAIADPIVQLDVWWVVESSWDGASLQYTTDDATWHTIGAVGTGINWYNHASIDAQPGDAPQGWSGDFSPAMDHSGGWVTARHDLAALAGEPSVRFRVAFASDFIFGDDGFAFDDFAVSSAASLPPEVIVTAGAIPPVVDLGAVPPGAAAPLLAVDLSVLGFVALDALALDNPGTIADAAIDWELWLDGGDGAFDPEDDLILATAPQIGGQVALALNSPLSLAIGTTRLFAVARLALEASPGDTFAATLVAPTQLSWVGAPSVTITPVTSALISIGQRVTRLPFDDDFDDDSDARWVRISAGHRVPWATTAGPVEGWSGPWGHAARAQLLSAWSEILASRGGAFLAFDYPFGPAVANVQHALDLSAYEGEPIWLRYRHADLGDEADPEDHLFLSVDGGLSWELSLTALALPDAPDGVWQETTVDLSDALEMLAAASDNVMVRLQTRDDTKLGNGDGLFLDHMRVGIAPRMVIGRDGVPLGPEGIDPLGAREAVPQVVHYDIHNQGDFTLGLTGFTIDAEGAADVAIAGATEVVSGNAGTMTVSFTPVEDDFRLEVTIAASDPRLPEGVFRFTMHGQTAPVAPDIDVQRPAGVSVVSGSVDFQGRVGGGERVLRYLVENRGSAELVVDDVSMTNAVNVSSHAAAMVTTIPPGVTAPLDVHYHPEAPGAFSFELQIQSNDPDEPVYRITATGEMVASGTNDGSCSCRIRGGGGQPAGIGGLLALLALGWLRRRAPRTLDAPRRSWLLMVLALGCAPEGPREPDAQPQGADAPPMATERVAIAIASRADGTSSIRDLRSGLGVRLRLLDALPVARVETGEGYRYHGVAPQVDLIVHLRDDGFEDLLGYAEEPLQEIARWQVDVAEVAGLRVIEGAVEMVDDGGAPRLRIARPYLIDAQGRRRPVVLTVEDCAYDTNPAPPWGRPPIAPGAPLCTVTLRWGRSIGHPVSYPIVLDPVWQDTASMHEARVQLTATRLGDGRIVVNGARANQLTTTEVYDPGTGTWALSESMGQPTYDHAAVLLPGGTKVLVIGGRLSDESGVAERMEIWENGTFRSVAGLPEPRIGHAACLLGDGRVLIAGGATDAQGSELLGAAVFFDPSSEAIAFGPAAAYAHFFGTLTCLADGTALLAGGAPGTLKAERFLPSSDSWTLAGTMSTSRRYHFGFERTDGKVVLATGNVATNPIDTVLEVDLYDPAAPPSSAFSSLAPIASGHYFGFATMLAHDRLLVGGGLGPSSIAELYDARNEEWFTLPALPVPIAFGAAVAPDDHTALAIGGLNESGPLATAWSYRLSANGDACTRDAECASYHCVEGICCDGACEGPCRSCSSALHGKPDGVCLTLSEGLPDPSGLCQASAGCGLSGLCGSDGVCGFQAPGTACNAPGCPLGDASCDGFGTCLCAPAACSDDGASFGAQDCAPYRCDEQGCHTSCQSSTQCQKSFLCDRTGHCTLPSAAPPDAGEGCACRTAPAPGPRGGGLLVLALALALARRRRR